MELQTIRQVSSDYGISRRMLCYYEKIGLIKSIRKDDYAYRVYEESEIHRLQQIIILRKLQIPMKQIKDILNNQNAVTVIEVFKKNISELDEEITALSALKSILARFIDELQQQANVHFKLDLLNETTMINLIDTLSFTKHKIKENVVMEKLNKATEQINKLTEKDVKIVYLPPATVASIHCIGNNPEDRASAILREFIQKTDLAKLKPDFRHYGFNHPNGSDDNTHGYEYWVTIPEDMVIEPPFTKREFYGGLYAAHTIWFDNFEKWHWLWAWVEANDKFTLNLGDPECMDGLIEEHFNYFNQYNLKSFDGKFQMDLMIPIKERV